MIEDLWTKDNRHLEPWRSAPTPDLIHHLVGHYHLEARQEMARMETLAEQAAMLDGAEPAGLVRLRDQVASFCLEFRAHMAMEERRLFPSMLALAQGRDPGPDGPQLLAVRELLEAEHAAGARLFWRLRALTAEAARAAGTGTMQARLHEAFRALEKSLRDHMFLEDQILFRRVG